MCEHLEILKFVGIVIAVMAFSWWIANQEPNESGGDDW